MIVTEDELKMRDMLKLLIDNARQQGREEVYIEILDAFHPKGAFKGRIYFDDATDLINTIKLRLKGKDE